jgi:hypothetical protein
MLEWRSDQEVYGKATTTENTSENHLCDDKPEAESKTQEELSQAMQPGRTTPGRKFFLVVCLKKY